MEHIASSLRGPGGVRLEYVEHGSREGVPVVILHGFSDSRPLSRNS